MEGCGASVLPPAELTAWLDGIKLAQYDTVLAELGGDDAELGTASRSAKGLSMS